MPYVEGRVVHDADAHIMELPDQLRAYADPAVRDRIPAGSGEASVGGARGQVETALARQADPAFRERAAREMLLHKNWDGFGSPTWRAAAIPSGASRGRWRTCLTERGCASIATTSKT